MKVSGGDPDEVQVNVKGEPVTTSIVDNEYLIITGEAEEYKHNLNNQLLENHSLLPLKYTPTLTF